MSILTIALIFFLALLITLLRGAGWAFVLIYLPTLIMLNQLPKVEVPHFPCFPQFAPLYGIMIGMPFRSESIKFKICSIDVIFVLLVISSVITALTTEGTQYFDSGINAFRNNFLTLAAPYFLARIVFRDWQLRRAALVALIAMLAIISVLALIEFRLWPYFYLHMLQAIGMNNKIQPMAYTRFGFNRVSGTVEHPIYFGNMCVVLFGMIAVLAKTSGVPLKNPWVTTALFASLGCLVTSISFTPYVGAISGIIAFSILMLVPFTRKLLFVGTLIFAASLAAFTYNTATQKLGEKPDGELEGSYYTRKLIVVQSYRKAATAGPFGYGFEPDFSDDEEYQLTSVDNSYMQFTITRGWVYTLLWTSIAIFFAWRANRAFFNITHPSQVFPLAAATATVLGLMVSMYTVWAGAIYTVIWTVMLGLSNTLIDSVLEASRGTMEGSAAPALMPPQALRYAPQRRGYPAVI
jgi:hypothetical protein